MKTTKSTPKKPSNEKSLPILIGMGAGAALTIGIILATKPTLPTQPTQITQPTGIQASYGPSYNQGPPRQILGQIENRPQNYQNYQNYGVATAPLAMEPLAVEQRNNYPENNALENSSSPETLPMGYGLLKPQSLEDTNKKITGLTAEQTQEKTEKAEKAENAENAEIVKSSKEKNLTEGEELPEADPRSLNIIASEGPNKEYEETLISVQRTLTAVLDNQEKQLIRLKIPVLYQSRTLALNQAKKAEAQKTLQKLKIKQGELQKFKGELEEILKDWNQLVQASSPNETLLPESPTLPQNQSNKPLNRIEHSTLAAGKNISYEIPSK